MDLADYLKVMQIPIKRGRFFTTADNEHSAPVVVIDESMAAKYFPNQDPIGQYLDFNTNPSEVDKLPNPQIIGIVGHVNQWGLDNDGTDALHAQIYLPLAQIPDKQLKRGGLGTDIFVRRQQAGMPTLAALRSRILEFNSAMVLHNPEEMEKTVADSLSDKRFTMTLLGVFALLALLLASIGIYGVLSYMVGQRTKEIGVRLALGAQRFDVLRMVLKDGARMTLAGILIGLVGAMALTRLMGTMLYGVRPTDPLTFYHGKDCRVSSNAKRQSKNGDQGKTRRLGQHANPITHVLRQRSEYVSGHKIFDSPRRSRLAGGLLSFLAKKILQDL